ncbi:CPBP family glutamic-type intramembrane protease [Methanosphaera sp. ISO3-F5]|uniref:CPBP family glutamic-type intramembrane protease n=1 Tax=Methanosphaera sp. ISO3-F5 TaxID=1452353 RepID=UPI002B25A7F7|nr:CPBP family glutamic-type intramembrane protease [Methanosphaera sp. ISO3-F5]WQH64675.1 CPBP family glutamic-type intramembrane protease [Methanosphaera sp. ISO3-F5]
MNNNDFFDFEDKKYDFPFYNQENKQSQNGIKILLLSTIIFIFLITGPIKLPNGQEQILLFIVTLIMLLLFTQGNIGTFFRLPEKKDIRLIIICYILFEVYYIALLSFFSLIHFQTTSGVNNDLNTWILLINILQIIAEEIFKALMFLLVLKIIYSKGFSRKKSIIISTIIVLLIFGVLHYNSYPNIIQIVFMQGLGGFAELYPYIKTKNLTLSVLVHICINFASWIPFMLR